MSKANLAAPRQGLLRCHGCGAVHPEHRNAAPDERTICERCEDRAEADFRFAIMLGLAVAADEPLYEVMAKVAPVASGVH